MGPQRSLGVPSRRRRRPRRPPRPRGQTRQAPSRPGLEIRAGRAARHRHDTRRRRSPAEPRGTFLPPYVPRRRLGPPEVFTRIAELERGAVEAEAVDFGDETPVEPTHELDPALIRRMYEESHDPHKRLMEYLAEHPDEWIYTSALASDLGLEHGARSLAKMLGAFGRRAQHRYSGRTPWESRWDGAAGEVKHKMTSQVAEEIKKVASGS